MVRTNNVSVGNNVLFVGGPEAGNVRKVPESQGDSVRSGDYHYRIWPFRLDVESEAMYFAYDAQKHPINLLVEIWRDYSESAQIKRDLPADLRTYRKAGQL